MGTKYGSIDIGGYTPHTVRSSYSENHELVEDNKRKDKIVENKMDKYSTKISVKKTDVSKIKNSKEEIEKTVSKKVDIKEKHVIGSYSNNTMIDNSKEKDVDIMIVVDEKKYEEWKKQENGPSNCLRYVKNAIESDPKYKGKKVTIDKNAVTVHGKNIKIDVVPAFKEKDGSYTIPDTHQGQRWIKTNPRTFKKVIKASDKRTNGRTSRVIKVVKSWNEKNGRPLKSYHIQNLVYQHFRNHNNTNNSLNEDVKSFFSRLPWYLRNRSYDPVYHERVDRYLNTEEKQAVIRKSMRTKNKLSRAEEYKEKGNMSNCINEYKQVFGEDFE